MLSKTQRQWRDSIKRLILDSWQYETTAFFKKDFDNIMSQYKEHWDGKSIRHIKHVAFRKYTWLINHWKDRNKKYNPYYYQDLANKEIYNDKIKGIVKDDLWESMLDYMEKNNQYQDDQFDLTSAGNLVNHIQREDELYKAWKKLETNYHKYMELAKGNN